MKPLKFRASSQEEVLASMWGQWVEGPTRWEGGPDPVKLEVI